MGVQRIRLKTKDQSRLRNVCFTINNPSGSAQQLIAALSEYCSYLVFQREIGDNGTPHFQGYMELHSKIGFKKLKKILPTAHLEARRGTAKEASDYCQKEDTRAPGDDSGPWIIGAISRQGDRKDITQFKELILSRKTNYELNEELPWMCARYPRYINFTRNSMPVDDERETKVYLFYGDPGSGKTKAAYEMRKDDERMWVVPVSDTLWFDGYTDQEIALIDDFTGWLKLDHLLRILDRYSLSVQIKGDFVQFRAKTIIVTSNKFPTEWYDWNKHGLDKYYALMRRFTEIKEFKRPVSELRLPKYFEDGVEKPLPLPNIVNFSNTTTSDPNFY